MVLEKTLQSYISSAPHREHHTIFSQYALLNSWSHDSSVVCIDISSISSKSNSLVESHHATGDSVSRLTAHSTSGGKFCVEFGC